MKKILYVLGIIFIFSVGSIYSQTVADSRNFPIGDVVEIELQQVTTTPTGRPLSPSDVFYDLEIQRPDTTGWTLVLAKEAMVFDSTGVAEYTIASSILILEGTYRIRGRAERLKDGEFVPGEWSDEIHAVLDDLEGPGTLIIRFK